MNKIQKEKFAMLCGCRLGGEQKALKLTRENKIKPLNYRHGL